MRAEFTKLRTVRGWMLGLAVMAVLIPLLGLTFAAGSRSSCSQGPVEVPCPIPPRGPGGEAVRDKLYLVHRPLTGDGSVTARVTAMSGLITYPPPDHDEIVPGLVPWAKAGVIVKDGTRPGSSYAAVMVTAAHGTRMQYDFLHDVAGRPGGVSPAAPRWLRLTRSGDTLTGQESPDGRAWTTVGTARLPGLPATVQAGFFVTSPSDLTVERGELGGLVTQARLATATAVFDHVTHSGAPGAWRRADIGASPGEGPGGIHHPGEARETGGVFTVTGNGDIAPLGGDEGLPVERTLAGALPALVPAIVVAVLFVTAEYRRGLIRTTLTANPRRGRVLAAKAVVAAAATFAVTLAAAAVTLPVAARLLEAGGTFVLPVPALTGLRVAAGLAALAAAAAVLAVALGALLRRGAAAVITVIGVLVLPYVLATASVLPLGLARWLLCLTPAAGFAVQQSIPEYAQVTGYYAPQSGYFPLPPWAGLAVTCGYAALALALAIITLRRRDV
ncbi:hypothetical protein Ssi03_02550 [Sphaerisporangium siamense]|uniref:ABC-type transport system involved in multi-copper enzyme maturation permease subunit n=1 Tax=Sphaerisporangium siamense TaxID=795645 RepID=A0A7W7GE88_9ACTN|nr:ABC transporter permease subunit [Sphaerisporangium siamense]MBB4703796.1 ABC-type transport system involved in multi-copper enzyme maturation permease subunit [Sphaerisporangium siamense]GII82265.1 hypothetical protein Ssi03_02550 [Sphaerisporangium siamense]